MENKFNRNDKIIALLFALVTIIFIVLAFTNKIFFNWAYERHQNQLSWYIRPLFLIPFCFFAYKRSWAGISGTIFLMLTSMFWFPKPIAVSDQVKDFLKMEMDYLLGDWGLLKALITLIVPISLTSLAVAFWNRNLYFGISVMVFIAVAKMAWSVAFGGEAGKSIFAPAMVGLIICIVLIYFGFRKIDKKK
ncbi:MAG: hypothetical protein K0R07_765 [Sedimentibacter sp.]|jgi:hypothetical protein|nr:hypothetical protein [Sedimentibacter sp.]